MKCPLCGHERSHKHGNTSKGAKRYFCPKCKQTFTDTFDTLYYRRQVSEEDMRIVRNPMPKVAVYKALVVLVV